jgi:hypothetical protein
MEVEAFQIEVQRILLGLADAGLLSCRGIPAVVGLVVVELPVVKCRYRMDGWMDDFIHLDPSLLAT